MCQKGSIAPENEQDDKLSNLTTALVFIERGEGSVENCCKLEPARKTLIEAIRGFKNSRFALGRALSEYKALYKLEKLWLRARDEIATALGCNPRTVSRIIEESEAAVALHPFVLEAMEQHGTDPGKKKNARVVEDLLKRPIASSRQEADAAVRFAVAKSAGKQKGKAKPASDSIEEFTDRMVKLFEDRFNTLSPEARTPELRYCIEKVLSALHTDIPTLYRMPISEDTHDTAAA